jgi:hypothetical protein
VSVCEKGVPAVSVGKLPGVTVSGEADGVMVMVNLTSPDPASDPSESSKTSTEPIPVDPL